MTSVTIEVFKGGNWVKTFTIHDYTEGKWKWVCRTVGTGGAIASGYMNGGTILMEEVQGQQKQIGFFTVSVYEIKRGDEFKISFLTSKPGEPETFLTLDCKCKDREDTTPQPSSSGKSNGNTKTIQEAEWELEQIRGFRKRQN